MVAAIAGFGIAAIVSGSLGPSLFAAFLPVSFLMGACSPLYAGTQTALMQEQIPPEYLGRVSASYGTIMVLGHAHGPRSSLRFCGSAWSSVMVRRLWSDHGTACDGYAACSERPKRGEKRYRADSIAQVFEKKEAAAIGSSVSLQALATTRYCTDIPHRAPYSSPTIIFGFAGLRKVKTLAPAIGQRRKIDVSNLFWHGCVSSKTLIHKRRFNLWNSRAKAKDIFLEYAGRDILDIEELEIYSYDRIGLVGDNGAGKTSLLKILSGNLTIADADVRRFGSIALIGQLDELAT